MLYVSFFSLQFGCLAYWGYLSVYHISNIYGLYTGIYFAINCVTIKQFKILLIRVSLEIGTSEIHLCIQNTVSFKILFLKNIAIIQHIAKYGFFSYTWNITHTCCYLWLQFNHFAHLLCFRRFAMVFLIYPLP